MEVIGWSPNLTPDRAAQAGVTYIATKEELMKPPVGARHYTISSTAGKHGDIWAWTTPDGKQA